MIFIGCRNFFWKSQHIYRKKNAPKSRWQRHISFGAATSHCTVQLNGQIHLFSFFLITEKNHRSQTTSFWGVQEKKISPTCETRAICCTGLAHSSSSPLFRFSATGYALYVIRRQAARSPELNFQSRATNYTWWCLRFFFGEHLL